MNRGISWLAAVLLAGAVAVWWWSTRPGSAWHAALTSREIAMRVLGEHLARRFPAEKPLVVGNPFTQRSGQAAEIYAFEKAQIRGLAQGLGSTDSLVVVYPELRSEALEAPERVFVDPKTTTPLSFLVREDAFDRLLAANPERNLVVSLVGLPVNVRQTAVWRDAAKPRLALLLPDWRMVGGPDEIRQAVKSEKIAAAVVGRPGAPSSLEPADKDYQAAFEKRFLLVTKDNVDELMQKHPHLF